MSEARKVHPLQKVIDNTWLLLAIGVLLPIVSYTLWGLFELQYLKPSALP